MRFAICTVEGCNQVEGPMHDKPHPPHYIGVDIRAAGWREVDGKWLCDEHSGAEKAEQVYQYSLWSNEAA